MDNPPAAPSAVGGCLAEAAGPRVVQLHGWSAASLRYFSMAGAFAAKLREALGLALPPPLKAAALDTGNGRAILAWRSPSETLLLCNEATAFMALERSLQAPEDGCFVDQSGGFCIFQVQGPRGGDLLQRLGSTAAVPALGAAHGCRLAEVHALTVSVQSDEILLVVERVYADHLSEWVRATAADAQPSNGLPL